MSSIPWLYRVVLRCYPRSFRADFGDEVDLFVAERLQEGRRLPGWPARVRLHAVVLRDLLVHAIAEHLRPAHVLVIEPKRARRRPILNALLQDLRSAARSVRRRPGPTVTAVLTLALGIGACTLFFGVVDDVLLQPLPFQEPERLALLFNRYGDSQTSLSPPDYVDRRDRASTLSSIAAMTPTSLGLSGLGLPRQVAAQRVTARFFDVLGVQPAFGRILFPPEEGEDPGRVVVLSHRLWQSFFAGDPAVVGRTVRLEGEAYEIQAVLPARSELPLGTDLWVPLVFTPAQLADDNRGNENLTGVARLAPDVPWEQVRAEMDSIAASVPERVPERADYLLRAGWGAVVEPLTDSIFGAVRPTLRLVSLAIGLVLLVACANVAHLQMHLASRRAAELGLRSCLGAGRGRILSQLLAESFLLALAGAGLGLGLAAVSMRWLPTLLPTSVPRLDQIGFDLRVAAFAVAVGALTALLVGLAPAWLAARARSSLVRPGGVGSRTSRRFRRGLVVSEVALAVLLLATAGLLLRGFQRLSAQEPGFDPSGRLSFRVTLPMTGYPDRERRVAFADRARDRLRALPEVRSVAVADRLPLDGRVWTGTFRPEGWTPSAGEAPPGAELNVVSESYFATMAVPLLAGRDFSSVDVADAPRVVIVDHEAAQRFWPDGAIGQRLTFDSGASWREIVGVVGHVRQRSLDEQSMPQVYVAARQVAPRELAFVLHTDTDPRALSDLVPRVLNEVAPGLPVFDLRTLEQIHRGSMSLPQFQSAVLSGFAVVALLLAAVGIYGVLALSVTERSAEIGVRLALGASGERVARQVVGEGLLLVGAGAALGLASTRLLSSWLAGSLYGLQASDATTYAVVVALCALVAVVLALVPARRAAGVDPVTALRAE